MLISTLNLFQKPEPKAEAKAPEPKVEEEEEEDEEVVESDVGELTLSELMINRVCFYNSLQILPLFFLTTENV